MNVDDEILSTKYTDDLKEKMDLLCQKMDFFKKSIRAEDDELLMTLFEAQHNWHELSVKLNKDIILLNKRILEFESMLREQK